MSEEKDGFDDVTRRSAPETYTLHDTIANAGDRDMSNGAWHELKEETGGEGLRSTGAKTRGSSNEIELEETERRRGPAPDGDNKAAGVLRSHAAAHPDGALYKVYKRRWFGLIQLTLLNIVASWDWLTFAPVSDKAAAYFGTNESAINWLSTTFMFANCIAMPAVIWTLHRGPRPSIVSAAALLLAGNWIRFGGSHSAGGGNFGVVMFGQILTGMAQAFVLAAPSRYSDLWFTNRGRVAATAFMSLANPLGGALGQLIVPIWVDKPGDVSRGVLYMAIISSLCAIPSFFIPAKPPSPAAPSSDTPKLSLRESVRVLSGHVEFWLIFVPFVVYVACFNSVSSLLNQILEPYGYTSDQAGIAGAVLIIVGLVFAAVISPILDRTKMFLPAIKVCVPLLSLSLLAFLFTPPTGPSLAGPYVTLAIFGASSFALVPVALEYLAEITHPISPEVTSTLSWGGGQLLGGCFIIISDALKDEADAKAPGNMQRALIFTAVVAMATMPLPLCIGLFGRADKAGLKRVRSDQMVLGRGAGLDHVA